MFEEKIKVKVYWQTIAVIISVLLISVLILKPNLSWANVKEMKQENKIPLLLNSEFIDKDQALIHYIVWTEEEKMIPQIEKRLKSTGLSWNKTKLSDYSGRNAYKYSVMINILKEEEKEAFLLYRSLNTLSGKKTKVFFQETIDTAMDVEAFFNSNHILVTQKIQACDIISLSGFDQRLSNERKISKDTINIQILSKPGKGSQAGKVVLALPSLIEEF